MKIRITGNKIRLRLKEPEVHSLFEGVTIKESLLFGFLPEQQLHFSLEAHGGPDLSIAYQPGSLLVQIPKAFAELLATTSKVGFDGNVNTGHSTPVYVLIEKDFECLDAPEEDNSGSYPHPRQVC